MRGRTERLLLLAITTQAAGACRFHEVILPNIGLGDGATVGDGSGDALLGDGGAATGDAPVLTLCQQWGGWSGPVRVTELNSPQDEWDPNITEDGNLYFASWRSGGLGQADIYFSTWNGLGFDAPILLSGISGPNSELLPAWSASDQRLYYSSDQTGTKAIWSAISLGGTSFLLDGRTTGVVNAAGENRPAFVSRDGTRFYFITDRSGSDDLWVARRSRLQESFSSASSLGSNINSNFREVTATESADGLELFFASNRNGDFDIYRATRTSPSAGFDVAAEVVELNTARDDIAPSLSVDGTTLYYVRDAETGGGANADIWVTTRGCRVRD